MKLRGSGNIFDTGQDDEAAKEQFFADLPPDGYLPEEEHFREAVLDYIRTWKAKEPPTVFQASENARIKKWRTALLSRCPVVTLKDWIERRIGGEVEVSEASGQMYLCGQHDLTSISKKRGGPGERGAPWKR